LCMNLPVEFFCTKGTRKLVGGGKGCSVHSWSLPVYSQSYKHSFKPGPVQGPGSGFWPGHRVDRVNFYFKKIQNDIVLVKKKTSQRVATGFLTGFCRVTGSACRVGRVTPGHDFSNFFINPVRFQLRIGRVPGWPARPDWILKL
jgi:hypothetical protein